MVRRITHHAVITYSSVFAVFGVDHLSQKYVVYLLKYEYRNDNDLKHSTTFNFANSPANI